MYINIENIHINYQAQGEGIPVIFLHGWGHSLKTFQHLFSFIAQYSSAYALDLPGFGESSEPLHPWNTTDYCNILEKFVLAQRIENPVLIGHSLGGSIAILYATRNPVRKLVLLNSAGVRRNSSLGKFCRRVLTRCIKIATGVPGICKHQDRIFNAFRRRFGSEDYRMASRLMQQTLSLVLRDDLRNVLPAINAPTLLIWGDKDSATPIADAKIMEKLIPDSGLVVYPNVGHFTFLERPADVAATIKYFLFES